MNLSSTIIFLSMILLFCKTDVIQATRFIVVNGLRYEKVDERKKNFDVCYKKVAKRKKIIIDINRALEKVAPSRQWKDGKYYVVEKSYKNLLPLIKKDECLALGAVLKEPLSCNPELIKNITNHELQQYLMKHEQPILYEIKKFFL
ncbi:MAG: hypothetical protein ACXWL2_00820 [Candidatus Chromulinivorax sp.]